MKDGTSWRRYMRIWGPDPLRDVDEELAFHLELKREELLASGIPPERLDAELKRAFGDPRRIERELKRIGRRRQMRARRAGVLDDLRVDLRQAWRTFRRRPAVPLVVVTTLALAIGAGTAVFSLFDSVVLNPVPVHRSSELFTLQEGDRQLGMSYPMIQHLRDGSSLARIAGHVTLSVALRTGEEAEQLPASLVTGNYFSVLALRPQHGRLLVAGDEAAPGSTPHAVLSDALWRRSFGADPDIVGRTVALNEMPFTVVGVAPPRFRGTSLATPVDVWVPITMVGTVARSGLFAHAEALTTWFFSIYESIARVPAGTPPERVLAELNALHAAGLTNAPRPEEGALRDDEPVVLHAVPLNESTAGRSRADLLRFLRMLIAAVVIALAVACVNVANLMMMRATERQREMSIRAAIGAGRRRVVRQLLVESSALALLAGTLGVGVALLAVRLLGSFALPGGIALAELSFALDLRMLAFTTGISLLCALAFGLAPALAGARADVMDALRGGGVAGRRGGWRGGTAVVAVQVALSIVLLVGGSLFVQSLRKALDVELGFRSAGVGTVSVGLRQHGYTPDDATIFVESVLAEAARRPGIERTAAATRVPIETAAFRMPITAHGGTTERPQLPLLQVTPGYLELLGLGILRGRGIEDVDRAGAPNVAVVTEAAARILWPGSDPLGQQFVPMFGAPFTVVGVIADAHFTRLTDREPHIFVPLAQTLNLGGMDRMRLVAAAQNDGAAIAALRAAVRTADPRLPVFHERSVQQHVAATLMPQRFGSVLLGAFAAIALLISAVGIYAVAAYDVARRHRELGIRAALGAQRGQLMRTVLLRAGLAIGAGILAGLIVAAFATQALHGLLFGITPREPFGYAAAGALLGAVAALASWIPARRAARVDPLEVMRE